MKSRAKPKKFPSSEVAHNSEKSGKLLFAQISLRKSDFWGFSKKTAAAQK